METFDPDMPRFFHGDPVFRGFQAVTRVFSFFIIFLFMTSARAEEHDIFSYKNFFIDPAVVSGIKGGGLIQNDIGAFIVLFNDGLYALSGGDLKKAETDLKKARALWPEYYATDLVLALIYEEQGAYSLSARYYKSYLKKLKKLTSGRYRLSGPLMLALGGYRAVPYDYAYKEVEVRLLAYGIDIDKVPPAADPAGVSGFFLMNLAVLAMIAAAYYFLLPVWKKKQRIKNAPDGFWTCPECGEYNPELRMDCQECARPRSVESKSQRVRESK